MYFLFTYYAPLTILNAGDIVINMMGDAQAHLKCTI